ncbi:MAG: 50S ribosomal protein L33 [Deltaproteobacteria bacterium]|nr:50S ribosomal protein L33 [Deltaproteobacteria bacterium]
MRDIVQLECTVCKRRNYSKTRNKRLKPSKMELSKYCKFDRKHTPHKESK